MHSNRPSVARQNLSDCYQGNEFAGNNFNSAQRHPDWGRLLVVAQTCLERTVSATWRQQYSTARASWRSAVVYCYLENYDQSELDHQLSYQRGNRTHKAETCNRTDAITCQAATETSAACCVGLRSARIVGNWLCEIRCCWAQTHKCRCETAEQ